MQKYRIVVYNAGGTADGINGDHVLIAPAYTSTTADVQFLVKGIAGAVKDTFADMISDLGAND